MMTDRGLLWFVAALLVGIWVLILFSWFPELRWW